MSRLLLLSVLFVFALTSPALAVTGEERALLDSISSYQARVTAKAEGAEGRKVTLGTKRFERCAKSFLKGSAVKRKLRSPKNKKFISGAYLAIGIANIYILSYRVYRPDILQQAQAFDDFNFSNPTLESAVTAGASRLRANVTFFTKARSPIPGCLMISSLKTEPWTDAGLRRAYFKGFGWTEPQARALQEEIDGYKPALKSGYNLFKADGASQAQLDLYSSFFEIS